MRTTVEISDSQRAALVRIAAERGEKGFSAVLREAVDLYLKQHRGRAAAVREALAARGALSDAEAAEFVADVRRVREHWR